MNDSNTYDPRYIPFNTNNILIKRNYKLNYIKNEPNYINDSNDMNNKSNDIKDKKLKALYNDINLSFFYIDILIYKGYYSNNKRKEKSIPLRYRLFYYRRFKRKLFLKTIRIIEI